MNAQEAFMFLQTAGASANVLSFCALAILVLRVSDLERRMKETSGDTDRVIRRLNHLLGKMGEAPLDDGE